MKVVAGEGSEVGESVKSALEGRSSGAVLQRRLNGLTDFAPLTGHDLQLAIDALHPDPTDQDVLPPHLFRSHLFKMTLNHFLYFLKLQYLNP